AATTGSSVMASSRSSRPADAPSPVERALAAWVASLDARRTPVAFALSGGRDSITLLDAGLAALRAAGREAIAFHIHHGLQAEADAWSAFCARICEERGLAFAQRRVSVLHSRRFGIECAARDARYAALRDLATHHGVRTIALAHHQDDQAETLLLQLGRGAGPSGLAGMPAEQTDAEGLVWSRPLLGVSRAAVVAYAKARGLPWIDDPSNEDRALRRNAVRAHVVPAFAAALPGYPATLARAAAHQADAASLLDALGAMDARDAGYGEDDGSVAAAPLATLEAPRARNLLRWFLRARGLRPPSAARLDAMLRQLAFARVDATIALEHAGAVVGRHRGRVFVHRSTPPDFRADWQGEASIALPHGELRFEACEGAGIDAARIGAGLAIRLRQGGERLQLAPGQARRALASLLRESALPTWERDALPLVVAGDTLVAVPGLGVDIAWRAPPGRPGRVPLWYARER
ncbi:MAG: tRNA lysidine(34) synthetase TilS, partial [Betaproteobacteria bacterium]